MKLLLLAVSVMLLAACGVAGPAAAPPGPLPERVVTTSFVDSSPPHAAAYALVPDKVLINFDRSLAQPSSIQVTKNGAAVPVSNAVISGLHNLSLSTPLPAASGDGQYVVTFSACRAGGACESGQFAFEVNSTLRNTYVDMTARDVVALDIREFKFQRMRTVVRKGTAVTWTNRDAVIHFVNTDPHPSHNNLPDLNSLELRQGGSYTFTFIQPGEWRYHCSAHQNMVGSVIVQ